MGHSDPLFDTMVTSRDAPDHPTFSQCCRGTQRTLNTCMSRQHEAAAYMPAHIWNQLAVVPQWGGCDGGGTDGGDGDGGDGCCDDDGEEDANGDDDEDDGADDDYYDGNNGDDGDRDDDDVYCDDPPPARRPPSVPPPNTIELLSTNI
eukprot:gene12802-biopygen11617